MHHSIIYTWSLENMKHHSKKITPLSGELGYSPRAMERHATRCGKVGSRLPLTSSFNFLPLTWLRGKIYFIEEKELWNNKLSDGATLKVKLVLTGGEAPEEIYPLTAAQFTLSVAQTPCMQSTFQRS